MTDSRAPRILVVDDDDAVCTLLHEHLSTRGYEVVTAHDARSGLQRFEDSRDFALVITDMRLGDRTGLELMEAIHERDARQRVVVITAYGNIALATQVMRAGAADFLAKPFSLEHFEHVVDRALAVQAPPPSRRREDSPTPTVEAAGPTFGGVARSAAMKRVLKLALRAARTDVPLLLTGESGVGKSMLARHIHEASLRARGPYVEVNAAAVPDGLLESELFGVRKGAFTGATSDRAGWFTRADGGTLFIDEVADLALALQPKLLRVLETGRFHPLGAEKESRVNVRVIAATNANLDAMVGRGEFREDLFYRLKVLPLEVPPLRERREDIPVLVEVFVEALSKRLARTKPSIGDEALAWLQAQPWKGNVRELRNVLERTLVLVERDELLTEDFTAQRDSRAPLDGSLSILFRSGVTLEELTARYVEAAVISTGGNKSEAARILGIDRKTLRRWLER